MTHYQWISGSDYGATDVLINNELIDGERYAIFESGAKVKVSELNSKLRKISVEDEVLLDSSNLEQEFYSKKSHRISDADINNIMYGGSGKTIKNQPTQNNVSRGSGTVFSMIEKQIKTNPHKLDILLRLPTLRKEFYEVLSKMHENVKQDILDIIVDSYISREELKKQIEQNLDLFYNDTIDSNSIEVEVEKF